MCKYCVNALILPDETTWCTVEEQRCYNCYRCSVCYSKFFEEHSTRCKILEMSEKRWHLERRNPP